MSYLLSALKKQCLISLALKTNNADSFNKVYRQFLESKGYTGDDLKAPSVEGIDLGSDDEATISFKGLVIKGPRKSVSNALESLGQDPKKLHNKQWLQAAVASGLDISIPKADTPTDIETEAKKQEGRIALEEKKQTGRIALKNAAGKKVAADKKQKELDKLRASHEKIMGRIASIKKDVYIPDPDADARRDKMLKRAAAIAKQYVSKGGSYADLGEEDPPGPPKPPPAPAGNKSNLQIAKEQGVQAVPKKGKQEADADENKSMAAYLNKHFPPAKFKGKKKRDPKTGKVFFSDGQSWWLETDA